MVLSSCFQISSLIYLRFVSSPDNRQFLVD